MRSGMQAAISKLTGRLKGYPRKDGCYFIAGISRAKGEPLEVSLERLFRQLDLPNSALNGFAPADYRFQPEAALKILTQTLVGGHAIGHSEVTVPNRVAEEIASEFMALFGNDAACFAGLDFGAPEFVFSQGILVADMRAAAILWVNEND